MNQPQDQTLTVRDNAVVTLAYTLEVDGQVVEETGEGDYIQFLQGHGQIIPGLESQLYDMSRGESKQVVVSPGGGYGEIDKDAVGKVPRDEFPSEIPLKKGVELQMRDKEGDVFDAIIEEVQDDTVRLDFNHPLAGKELHFTVTVVDLRPASEEEIEHGHVHE